MSIETRLDDVRNRTSVNSDRVQGAETDVQTTGWPTPHENF